MKTIKRILYGLSLKKVTVTKIIAPKGSVKGINRNIYRKFTLYYKGVGEFHVWHSHRFGNVFSKSKHQAYTISRYHKSFDKVSTIEESFDLAIAWHLKQKAREYNSLIPIFERTEMLDFVKDQSNDNLENKDVLPKESTEKFNTIKEALNIEHNEGKIIRFYHEGNVYSLAIEKGTHVVNMEKYFKK